MARVFVSYSSKDTDIANKIVTFLQQHGVTIWIDHMSLRPGTPNWDTAIRQGIAQAEYVLYLASQAAVDSVYVLSELEIAHDQGKNIVPLWIEGNRWSSVVPIGLAKIQHIDARGEKLESSLLRLIRLLEPFSTPASSTATTALPEEPAVFTGSPIPISPSLSEKGFVGKLINGVEVILPPTVTIPGGPFLMGSDKEKDSQASNNETPQYLVPVAPFAIGVFPLTVGEYECFVRATKRHKPGDWGSQRKNPDRPVVNISWFHAMAYAKWLANTTRERWRLPSEAEWEKAARGTDGRIYPWGDQWIGSNANTQDSGSKTTTAVGSYPKDVSPYGCLDMAGNVREWTSSLKRPYPYSTKTNSVTIWDSYIIGNSIGWVVGVVVFVTVFLLYAYLSIPIPSLANIPELLGWILILSDGGLAWLLGGLSFPSRVVRGGSWGSQSKSARAAIRDSETIDTSALTLGTRMVRA